MKDISRASMTPEEVGETSTTDPIFILIENVISSRKLLFRVAAYDTVQQRIIISIQEIKASEMEMMQRKTVGIPKRYGEEEGRIINPKSSSGIYVTASVEAECILIAQNRNMKEQEKIKILKVNALKRAAHINQREKLFAKIVEKTANLPNEMMDSE